MTRCVQQSERHDLVLRSELAATLDVTVRTIQRWCKAGRFPAPLADHRPSAWIGTDLVRWLVERHPRDPWLAARFARAVGSVRAAIEHDRLYPSPLRRPFR